MIYKIPCAVFIRQDTVENWEKFNPVLRDGEIALVKNDGDRFIIIGDGKTSYSELTKVHLGEAELYLQKRNGESEKSMSFVTTLGEKRGLSMSFVITVGEKRELAGKTDGKKE